MSDESGVAAAIRTLVDAVNCGNITAALSAFTQDAVIVEDLAPYRWTGADAPSQWLAAMGANASKLGITSILMESGEATRIDVEGSRAYAVVPGLLRLATPGLEMKAKGVITFTLVRRAERWLIDALVWSGPRPE